MLNMNSGKADLAALTFSISTVEVSLIYKASWAKTFGHGSNTQLNENREK
jgi:hypothetical protein